MSKVFVLLGTVLLLATSLAAQTRWETTKPTEDDQKYGWEKTYRFHLNDHYFSISVGQAAGKVKVAVNASDQSRHRLLFIFVEGDRAEATGRRYAESADSETERGYKIDPPIYLFNELMNNTDGLPPEVMEKLNIASRTIRKRLLGMITNMDQMLLRQRLVHLLFKLNLIYNAPNSNERDHRRTFYEIKVAFV